MRYTRIFFLHMQSIFEHRSRSLVWFLISLANPLLLLLFWKGTTSGANTIFGNWSFSAISSYYFLLIIASAFLTSHIEEDIAKFDIQLGVLSKYLLRPFSYLWMKFFEEIPYRILQGFYGVIVCILFLFLFGNLFVFTNDSFVVFQSLIIIVFAYFLSFIFKMIIGLLAFWLIETGGFYQLVEMILLIFAGYLMPLSLLPAQLMHIAYALPFSYMIYFPIVALEGKLTYGELVHVIGMQALWLLGFIVMYKIILNMGLRKFTALGQ